MFQWKKGFEKEAEKDILSDTNGIYLKFNKIYAISR